MNINIKETPLTTYFCQCWVSVFIPRSKKQCKFYLILNKLNFNLIVEKVYSIIVCLQTEIIFQTKFLNLQKLHLAKTN